MKKKNPQNDVYIYNKEKQERQLHWSGSFCSAKQVVTRAQRQPTERELLVSKIRSSHRAAVNTKVNRSCAVELGNHSLNLKMRAERLKSGDEHWLLFQKTYVSFPAHTCWLTIICNSSYMEFDALLWPWQALYACDIDKYMQENHPYT